MPERGEKNWRYSKIFFDTILFYNNKDSFAPTPLHTHELLFHKRFHGNKDALDHVCVWVARHHTQRSESVHGQDVS